MFHHTQIVLPFVDLLAIPIVGILVSLLVNWLKKEFAEKPSEAKGIAIVVSIIVGGAYWLLRDTEILVTIVSVLGIASTFYALILKKQESDDDSE